MLFFNRHIATPLSSLPPPLESSAPSSSTSQKIRKKTWLRSLATRLIGAKKPVVHVDPATGKTNGPHRKKLRTYLGIITQDKVDVTFLNCKEVPAAQKDLIWEDIQVFQLNVEYFCNWLYSKS